MIRKILFLVNHDVVIYNFRKELVERLLQEHYEVIISSPYGERIELLKEMGCRHIPIVINRHGMNPLEEWRTYREYKKLLETEKPDMVFAYTIKPNIYGTLAAHKYKIPCIVNISGLGTAVGYPGLKQKITIMLYKAALRNAQTIFMQNTENQKFFLEHKIVVDKLKLLPGSGVNLKEFHVLDYPGEETVEFVFIGRVMREKGIDEYLAMAEYIQKQYPETRFHVCGFCEGGYETILREYAKRGIIIYHGLIMDVREVLQRVHCTVHPSFYPEGMSNALLESCACGRPIITTDQSGCREIVDDGVNGYMCRRQDSGDLIRQVEKFLTLSNEEKRQMGLAGRRKVELEFDRNIVVEKYMNEVRSLKE